MKIIEEGGSKQGETIEGNNIVFSGVCVYYIYIQASKGK
jgi:hypothetical protein